MCKWSMGATLGRAERFVLIVTLVALTACDSDPTDPGVPEPPAATPAEITIVSGGDQNGEAGAELGSRLVVRLVDSNGSAVTGATVEWAVALGGGSVHPASSTTNAQGLADATWTLGAPGQQQATATVQGLPAVTFMAEGFDLALCEGGNSITTPTTLPNLGPLLPYRVSCTLTVASHLTLEAGVALRFAEGARFIVQSDGWLSAIGTEADTIRFLGDEAVPGHWGGIEMRSDSLGNRLRYVEVAHGGRAINSGNVLIAGGGAMMGIEHSLIRDSAKWGVRLATFGKLSSFAGNELRDNAEAGLWVPSRELGSLDDASIYAGGTNGRDMIDVQATNVESDQTWPKTDAPYLMHAGNTVIKAAVAIEPGARFHFVNGTNDRLVVDTDGVLSAMGTASDVIVFTGAEPVPGHWGGIEIRSSGNQMAFVEVTYGGRYQNRGNLYLSQTGRLSLQFSEVRASSSFGIYVTGPRGDLTDTGNTCSQNPSGEIRFWNVTEEDVDDC